jgi:two-component system, NtrC family, sensor kinase
MKRFVFILIVLLRITRADAQADIGSAFVNDNYADSLIRQAQQSKEDSNKVKLYIALGDYYTFIRQDSSIFYFVQSIELAEKINFAIGSYWGYAKLAFVLNTASNYGKALEMALKSLRIAEKFQHNRQENMARSYNLMGLINRRNGYDTVARDQCRQSIRLYEEAGITIGGGRMNFGPFLNLAIVYLKWKNWDSAFYFAKNSYDIVEHYPSRAQAQLSVASSALANVYERTGKIQLAREYYQRGIESDKKFNVPLLRVRLFNNYAEFFKNTGQLDSCIYYAKMALELCRNHQFGEQATDAANLIAKSYESLRHSDSALKYTKIFMAARDTIFNQTKLTQIQLLNFDEGQRQKDIQREIDAARERYTNQIRYFVLIATAALFLLLSIILYRNNRSKQIANKALELQKKEVEQQRSKAENTLQELRSTQAQLIQSEKMASLGELTAGIAHEIQNPLNFVNNFSEINKELLVEMREEIEKGNMSQAKHLTADIIDNEDKIMHHGKRADAIVKGMLQHSRTGFGQKEPIDINALADEYLRLAYHGLKAKDKSFHATLQTSFDSYIGKIQVVPQDMGRVFLNLYNNAFYAVSEKNKQLSENFEPIVSIGTKRIGDKLEIRIKDNGNGIPQKVIDKIFQPFFTTKPTGQGTGLGLSMSYDIVKAHGGSLIVHANEGEGAEFVIQIPMT